EDGAVWRTGTGRGQRHGRGGASGFPPHRPACRSRTAVRMWHAAGSEVSRGGDRRREVGVMRVQRSIAILIGAVAVLLLAGIILALVATRRPEASFPPDSAEGTVATYLRLLQDGRVDEAYDMTALE